MPLGFISWEGWASDEPKPGELPECRLACTLSNHRYAHERWVRGLDCSAARRRPPCHYCVCVGGVSRWGSSLIQLTANLSHWLRFICVPQGEVDFNGNNTTGIIFIP